MGDKKDYEVLIEIGHKSAPLKKITANGYTHKWTVYLKGYNDAKIEHCISHVVFQLHESFDNPQRVLREPPYQVKETGYAGFELPIEVYFKNREKPNHVVYVHNLELLAKGPHSSHHIEKVMFLNPNREFEKCLVRTGAQVHASKLKIKKDRSVSPPSKKRKSASALIPSKDMGKLNLPTQSNGHSPAKPESRDFMDLFGVPLVYSKKNGTSSSNSNNNHTSNHQHRSSPLDNPTPPITHVSQTPRSSTAPTDTYQILQSKIASLTDADRLQKIVDIIEESGEWFNLTSKKFEFDLKRLDKKTLHKIEKCLH